MIKRYKCVVVANGLFPTGQQALELLRQAEFVVACDGAVIGLENGNNKYNRQQRIRSR